MFESNLRTVPLGYEAAFPQEEFTGRLDRLRDKMTAKGFDYFLTTGPENIFYLSGQQTPGYYAMQCLGVPREGTPFLLTRELESYNARANTFLEEIETYADTEDPATALGDCLGQRDLSGQRIAIDKNAWFLTANLFERLEATIGPLADGSGLVEILRRVKSALEIDAIEAAAKATDSGMLAGLAAVKAGSNENDVAAAVMSAMIVAGSEYVGMEPFVTSGRRGGLPHSNWRRKRLEDGDLVIIENAACYNRYHIGLFRTVAVGNVPDLARSHYQVCLDALTVGIEATRPGNRCADVHDAVQAVIDAAGCTDGYRKRAGYSQGIAFAPDWGEGNVLSLNSGVETVLEPGMVFHIPVTLRDYFHFTVAVSESVVVTETGNRTLSTIARDLISIEA